MIVTVDNLAASLAANGCSNIICDDTNTWTSVSGTFNERSFELIINGTELQLYCLHRPTKEHIARMLNM